MKKQQKRENLSAQDFMSLIRVFTLSNNGKKPTMQYFTECYNWLFNKNHTVSWPQHYIKKYSCANLFDLNQRQKEAVQNVSDMYNELYK